jgi:hypothetical protein
MSALIHCDGPDCDRQEAPADGQVVISSAVGAPIRITGWFSVRYGGDYHFHNADCLTSWLASR